MPSHKVLSYVFNRATVAKGEQFEVRVPSMASYGWQWKLEGVPAGLSEVGSHDIPPNGGSAKSYTFRAEEKGIHEFAIKLVHPDKPKPQQNYKFKITVK